MFRNQTIQLTIIGVLLLGAGGAAGYFLGRTAEVSDQPVASTPPFAQTSAPAPQFSANPDRSLEGKDASIKDLGDAPARFAGVRVNLSGRIVQVQGTPGTSLRDANGYVIRLDLKEFKGDLSQFTAGAPNVKVTGSLQVSDGETRESPLSFLVQDIQRL